MKRVLLAALLALSACQAPAPAKYGDFGPKPASSSAVVQTTTQTALAALSVLSYPTGQRAYLSTPRLTFILQAATAGAANGVNVVATADDTARQWIQEAILSGQAFTFITGPVDLTATGSTAVVPGIAGYEVNLTSWRFLITSKAGTLSTSPTWQMGNDAAQSNIGASITTSQTTGFAGTPPCNGAGGNTLNQGATWTDGAGAPVMVKITAGATGTGGFVLMGKHFIMASYVPSS